MVLVDAIRALDLPVGLDILGRNLDWIDLVSVL